MIMLATLVVMKSQKRHMHSQPYPIAPLASLVPNLYSLAFFRTFTMCEKSWGVEGVEK